MKYILVILTFFIINTASAQSSSDYSLALKYYRAQEYEKASVLFNKLYKKSHKKDYFSYYLSCLLELKDYSTAEKIAKKQIKRYSTQLTYQIELGYVYKEQGLIEKAEKQFNTTIENSDGQKYTTINLSNAFAKKRDYVWAERVFLLAREKNNEEMFRYELASVYTMDRNYKKLVAEYVEILVEDEVQISNIQRRMQYLISNDVDDNFSEILRKAVLRKLQEEPNKTILNELLIWLFVQKKNFSAALSQEIAVDKRFDLAGQRVLKLGDLALSNEDFTTAKKCYNYVIEIGNERFFYPRARIRLLKVKYQVLTNDKKTKKEAYLALEAEYLNTMNTLGQSLKTIPLMIDLAHIQAFYLDKMQHAIDLLDYASGLPRINSKVKAKCFLEMGDIYMMKGEVWEATLIYAKVEKENEQNPMGHEAKFRKARLAFYIGDFRWAEAQLDALKAATTKLIANDALQLSQLIKDNLSDDTITEALQIYARAGLLELQRQDSLAFATLDSISDKYPANSIIDETILQKANIMHTRKEYKQEAVLLQEIIDNYYFDILADDAIFRLAKLNELKFKDLDKAKELYEIIITEFAGSIYLNESRKRFRELRGDNNL